MQPGLIHNETTSTNISKPTMLQEVVAGLSARVKTLPCKFFYDSVGSALFDEICDLPEYYPTRTETGIMREYVQEMMSCVGEDAALIEYGSGSSVKTRILLDHSNGLDVYVPVDISSEHLHTTASALRIAYPNLTVIPVTADYTHSFELPSIIQQSSRRVIYFPGSTIGNFHRSDAINFLRLMAGVSGKGGGMLIGVDLKKDVVILEEAYNDKAGVTGAFNKNILTRINTDLQGTFALESFRHSAHFNEELGRIEMHLISDRPQEVWVEGFMFKFAQGESIWTESSYKYSIQEFAELAALAGWNIQSVWTDPKNWFSVQYFTTS